MSDARFLQHGFEKRLAHLVEECGEVLAAAGKTQRWGPHSVNPLLPSKDQETNAAWLWREIEDLEGAAAVAPDQWGEWIEWSGGDNPVPGATVEIRFGDGGVQRPCRSERVVHDKWLAESQAGDAKP